MKIPKRHLTTDPACSQYREPRSRLGWWRFNRNRGRACLLCVTRRALERLGAL